MNEKILKIIKIDTTKEQLEQSLVARRYKLLEDDVNQHCNDELLFAESMLLTVPKKQSSKAVKNILNQSITHQRDLINSYDQELIDFVPNIRQEVEESKFTRSQIDETYQRLSNIRSKREIYRHQDQQDCPICNKQGLDLLESLITSSEATQPLAIQNPKNNSQTTKNKNSLYQPPKNYKQNKEIFNYFVSLIQ